MFTLYTVNKNGSVLLVDTKGIICGVFATEKDALKSKPKIERNLTEFYTNGKLVHIKAKSRHNRRSRPKSKQVQK